MKKKVLMATVAISLIMAGCGSASSGEKAEIVSSEVETTEETEKETATVQDDTEPSNDTETAIENVEAAESETSEMVETVSEVPEESSVDPATVIPENPDYDSAYQPIYDEIRHAEGTSDYISVYFADSNDDGVVEMWISGGGDNDVEPYYEVYTVRESGAVLLEHVDGTWVYYETYSNFPHPWQCMEMYGTDWPGMDTILSFDGMVTGLPYNP